MMMVPHQFNDAFIDDIFHQVSQLFLRRPQLRSLFALLHDQLTLNVLLSLEMTLLAALAPHSEVLLVTLVLLR